MCMKPPLVAQTSPISNLYAVETAWCWDQKRKKNMVLHPLAGIEEKNFSLVYNN